MFMKSPFDKIFDKATSNLRLEADWPSIIQICDLIRQGDVPPKHVLAAIKKKLTSPNPHVVLFTLQVLESCVKNCGSLIHEEIGTKAWMEQMREVVKATQQENVRNKILELLQAWAYAFRNSPKYRAVQDTVNIMNAEGYKFPAMKESDAMFVADTAPEWADGQCCHRCRVQFTVMQRKHHCRACGQVFCNQCSTKTCTLPKFGIEKEVRVCEACYDQHTKPVPAPSSSAKTDELPIEYLKSSLAQQSQAPPPRKSEQELKEEEELQLAIALSQSEAESKHSTTLKSSIGSSPINAASRTKSYSPPPQLSSSPEDPELARYLNRNFWQKQANDSSTPSAPIYATVNKDSDSVSESKSESEMDDFIYKLGTQLEIFVNRMKSNSSRGRSIANDSSVQTLFMNITEMHSQLLQYVKKQDDKRVYFEGLQDKLTQVRDARAALDALRDEHREQLRREAEAAEKLRQMQMAQKLDIMRQKKQEYLQYQRQLALQRIQEQEREMQMRQEQQKQQNLRGSYSSLPYYPSGLDSSAGMNPYPPPQAVYAQPYGGMMGHEYMMGSLDGMPPAHLMSPMGGAPMHIPPAHIAPPHMVQSQASLPHIPPQAPGHMMQQPGHIPGHLPPVHIPPGPGPAAHMPPGQAPASHLPPGQAQTPHMPLGQNPAPHMPPGQNPAPHMPLGQAPSSHLPPGQAPSHMPTGQASGSHMPPGQAPGHLPAGHLPPGQVPAHMPSSHLPPGQAPPGHMPPSQGAGHMPPGAPMMIAPHMPQPPFPQASQPYQQPPQDDKEPSTGELISFD